MSETASLDRRAALLSLLVLAVPMRLLARGPAARVVYLSREGDDGQWLLPALAERGYIEGQGLRLSVRPVEGDAFDAAARKAVAENPDALMTGGVVRVRKLMALTRRIPIICMNGSDAVGAGLAKSLARPGYNVTGFSIEVRETAPIIISLVRALRPGLRRIVVVLPYGPATLLREGLRPMAEAAGAAGIAWEHKIAGTLQELDQAFAGEPGEQVAAFLAGVPPNVEPAEIAARLNARRIATISGLVPEWVEDGALMCYQRVVPDKPRRVAALLDKVLRGMDPGTIPFEVGDRDELVLNRATARRIGVTIPQEVLLRATRVID